MENIKGNYPKHCHEEISAQLQLQNKMLSQLINHKDNPITHLGVTKERLKDRRVLLVLDDVDRVAQLDALAGDIRWFGPGSRIIITTKDQKVLKTHGINHIYKVDYLTHEEALPIFCMHVFGQESPYDGFEELARKVIKVMSKLPLDHLELKEVGSIFRGLPKEDRKLYVRCLRGWNWCSSGFVRLYRHWKEPPKRDYTCEEKSS